MCKCEMRRSVRCMIYSGTPSAVQGFRVQDLWIHSGHSEVNKSFFCMSFSTQDTLSEHYSSRSWMLWRRRRWSAASSVERLKRIDLVSEPRNCSMNVLMCTILITTAWSSAQNAIGSVSLQDALHRRELAIAKEPKHSSQEDAEHRPKNMRNDTQSTAAVLPREPTGAQLMMPPD